MTTIKERTEIAKENKRDIPTILKEIQALATLSNEVALSCFYVVFNKEDNKPFVGISVRFAELIASCWGNIHTGAKITKNNGMSVVVQGFVHDFEKNAVFTVEVQRSIGKLSAERAMQATNAASSIAFRNAIFKAIPAAITNTVAQNIKKYIAEDIDGNSIIKDVSTYFESKGIKPSDIEKLLGDSFMKDIDSEKLFLLIGLKNAIEEGDTTIAELFGKGEVIKSQRSSRFSFESEGEEEFPQPIHKETESTPADSVVDSKGGIGQQIGVTFIADKGSNQQIPAAIFVPAKEALKSGISSLAETKPKVEVVEEVIEDEPKEEPKKKRGRGRPKKNEN